MKRLHAYALRDSTSFAIPKGQAINCGIKRTAKLFCRRSSFHRHGPLASKPEAGVTDRRYGAIPGSAYWRHQMIGA